MGCQERTSLPPINIDDGGALIGVFVSLDMFVFYAFWELTLVPMFFLIMIWGGEDRKYASMKFFIYTFTASVIMLIGILVMYLYTPDVASSGSVTGHSFDMSVMISSTEFIPSEGLRHLVWLLLLIGFATKMPSVPVTHGYPTPTYKRRLLARCC